MRSLSIRFQTLALWIAVAAVLGAQTPGESGMLTTTATGGFISIPDNPSLTPSTGAMTIEAWFYYTQGGGATICRKSSGYPAYLLRVSGPFFLDLYISVNGSFVPVSTSVPSVANTWHHLAGTYDGQFVKLFFDGVQVNGVSAPGILTDQPGNLQIGQGANSQEQWAGSIDEVRLWSVARTAAQLQASRGREIEPQPGLVSVWRLNGDLQDHVGSNHASQVGGVITLPVSTSPVVGTYLVAPAVTAIGSPVLFDVVSADAGLPYLFDVSISGTSPGILLGPPIGVTIPLNPPLLNFDLGYALPAGMVTNFLGIVPPMHHATPVLQLPALSALTGITLSSTFVIMDPGLPSLITHVAAAKSTAIAGYPPAISSVTPPTSPQSGGTVITILGAHFQPGATVSVDGVPATGVSVTPTSLTATTPPNALGPADVAVTNPDTLSTVAMGALTYVPNLVLTSITPAVATPGAAGTISGSGMVPGLALSAGGIPITPSAVAPSSISFVVPPGVPCNAIVTVVNPDLQTQTLAWNPAPVIIQGVNLQGPAAGGGSFLLLGSFTSATTVTVGGVSAVITQSSPTAIIATAPPGSLGPAAVIATSLTGCTAATTYVYQ